MRIGVVVVLVLAFGVGAIAQDDAARRELLPTGKLRVGLNSGNRLTVSVGKELGRELARRLGTEVVFIDYPNPGAVTDAVSKGWDIAMVAADPDRAATIAFTPPYAELDATYLVPGTSPIRSVKDVDRTGITIATGATSAYTLVLKRELTRAELAFMPPDMAIQALQAGTVQAFANLRDTLVQLSPRVPGSRVLPDTFTRAQQAIAVPKDKNAALAYLTSFLAEVKRNGFVSAAIGRSGAIGASVAAP